MPFLSQAPPQDLGHLALVFDNQDPHGRLPILPREPESRLKLSASGVLQTGLV
jgi:hypothetical protein